MDVTRILGIGHGTYPVWLRRSLILGGILAILTAGVLIQLGFLSSAAAADDVGLRAAAQVFGVGCLALGLLSLLVPYAEQAHAASAGATRSHRIGK